MVTTSRLRLYVARAAALVVAVLFALGAAETALRVAHYWPPLSSEWMLGNQQRVLDPDTLTIDRRYRTDAFYAPYAERGSSKLVVALGDSFTIGFPVKSTDAYPDALERVLRERSFDVRVMNVGMGDTGPDQQLRLFTKYVLPHATPDVVVWQFYPNDTYDNAIKPLFDVAADDSLVPMGAATNWMYRRQQFVNRLPFPSWLKKRSYLLHLSLRRYEHDLEAQVPAGRHALEWGRHKIELEIARMNELARQHRFRVYYTLVAPQALYRDETAVGSTGYRDVFEYERLLAILEKEPTFIYARFGASSLDKDAALGNDLFVDGSRDPSDLGSRHLNESGYQLLAQMIGDRLLRENGRPSLIEPPVTDNRPIALHFKFGDREARRVMRRGFQQDESSGSMRYVWSDGLDSVLDVPLPTGADVRMDFECRPFVYPGGPEQTVSIALNGHSIGRVTLRPDAGGYSVVLPKSHLRDSPNRIELRYGHVRRPMDVIAGSSDSRSLAVAWVSVDFTRYVQ